MAENDHPAAAASPVPAAQEPEARVRGRLPLEEMAGSFTLLRKVIVRLAWPVAAEMLLHTLTQIVDMMMVSRLGKAPIAAVGLSFRPMFLFMSVFLGIGAGTTALVARSMGRREPAEAAKVTHQATMATILVAVVFAAGIWALAPWIQSFMGAEADVLPLGTTYMRAVSWGLPFMYISMVLTSALRGAGDTHTSMRVNAAANIVNVVLNYALIFGHFGLPRLEVQGAAIATSLSRAAAGIVIIGLTLRGKLVIPPPARLLSFDPAVFLRVARVGIPASLERVLLSLAMIFHLKMLAVEGTVAVAAATLSQNIEELSHMPSIGLSVSASALVGQFLGHERPDMAAVSGRECVKIALVFMGVMGLLFVVWPGVFLALYAPEPDVFPVAVTLLQLVGLAQPFMAVAFVLAGALRGAGDTRSVAFATAFSVWGVRLSLTYVFMNCFGWGYAGAWGAMVIDSAVRAAIVCFIFVRGGWRKVKV